MTAATSQIKLSKIAAGHYAAADGRYAVVADGYTAVVSVGADNTGYEGFQGGEWAAIHDPAGQLRVDHQAGETLDWFPTKRDAVACVQRHAAR